MATWKNFEELKAWQKARKLSQRVYELTNRPPFSTDCIWFYYGQHCRRV
jgi:hypothetical protein